MDDLLVALGEELVRVWEGLGPVDDVLDHQEVAGDALQVDLHPKLEVLEGGQGVAQVLHIEVWGRSAVVGGGQGPEASGEEDKVDVHGGRCCCCSRS